MSLVLLMEGDTERKSLKTFLKGWLDRELNVPVDIKAVNFKGSGNYVRELNRKLAFLDDEAPQALAIFGLVDLYGLDLPYPKSVISASDKQRFAKQHLEQAASHPKFRQHFAVHDVEAWLLSDPDILPRQVREALPGKAQRPETVNFRTPPGELLKKLYLDKTNKKYRKTVDGTNLFARLDPYKASAACPALLRLLQDMLAAAKTKG